MRGMLYYFIRLQKMNSVTDSKNVKNCALHFTLTALKTSILTFDYKMCSVLEQEHGSSCF